MTRDRWTLVLLKGEASAPRQFTVSPRSLRIAAGGAGFVAIVFLLLGAFLVKRGASHLEAQRLRSQNALLSTELDALHSRVSGLEATMGELTEDGAEVRLLAGLESLDDDVLQVGVGGPGMATPERHPLWPVDSTLGKTAFAVNYDVMALERRARLLTESMSEAADSLRAHRALLESTPSILPTPGLLSSGFSRERIHPIHHQTLAHEGIDVSAPRGTPIMAAARGKVIRSGWVSGYGQMVEVDHGFGYVTRYGHASKLLVRVGQTVERGDVIAQVGRTGIATSSHLHYEVLVNGQPQNPMNYVLRGSVP